jgi:16S rRNA (guanine1207-N2)-methyltransferase
MMGQSLVANNSGLMLVPQGEFELLRNPRDDYLRGWDAADELLLGHLQEIRILNRDSRVLIVNDSFGALAVALADSRVYSWNDSCLAQKAMMDNLLLNGYQADRIEINPGIDFPDYSVDCVLIKIPKTLALLEHQLFLLRRVLHRDSRIIAAAMARYIHSSTLELFETILGPTTTTRAWKKSRLIKTERDHSMNEGQSQFPESYQLVVDREYQISNHASLFSRDRLDQGSRFLIENMPVSENYNHIVDLGCGNGVLGIIAASLNPQARLLFSDESHMAIASAEENFDNAFAQQRQADFMVGDCLQTLAPNSRDLVLNNPPFHQQHSNSDVTAWNMFKDARRALAVGGELWVVGNRHLGYHVKLKKLFGNCETRAGNKKYVILKATKT